MLFYNYTLYLTTIRLASIKAPSLITPSTHQKLFVITTTNSIVAKRSRASVSNKKMKQTLFLTLLLLAPIFSLTTLAQSPAAAPKAPAKPAPSKPAPATPAPAPAKPLVPALPQSPTVGPDSSGSQDIVKILRKAKSFNTLIRLLKTTQIINQVNAQLVTSKNGGLTILAPDDGAFSELKAGYFNSLGDRQQKALLQYHVLPVYVSSSNFDSLSNPVLTLASDSPTGFQFNVTAYGNSVNISTGVVNATLTGIVYSDKTLAIYHVDKVLIPLDFSKPKPIAPAPALAKAPKADKENSSAEDDDQDQGTKHSSGAIGLATIDGTTLLSLGVGLLATAWC